MIANHTLRVLGQTIYAGQQLPELPEDQAQRLIASNAVKVSPKPQPKKEVAKKRTRKPKTEASE